MEAAVQETTNLPAVQERKKSAVVPLETGGRVAPIVPRTIEEVGRVAKAVIIAGLAPRGYEGRDENETISKIMIGIMKGAEVGLAPLTALANIAIINGRPTIWGDGAMALVQSSGVVDRVEQFYEGEEGTKGEPQPNDFPDGFAAVYRIHRKGHSQAYEGRFSVKDAKRAHLWGNTKKAPWIEYPKRMLMMRARAFALRDGFADALSGLSIREEIEDLPPEAPAKADVAFLSDGPEAVASVHVVDVEPIAETVPQEPISLFLPIPTNAEGNDYDAWVKIAEEVVRLIPTPRALVAWRDANRTTIDGLKHTGKNGPALQKHITDMIEGRRSDLLAGAV